MADQEPTAAEGFIQTADLPLVIEFHEKIQAMMTRWGRAATLQYIESLLWLICNEPAEVKAP